jgi:Xaa-Pro dipeptidase
MVADYGGRGRRIGVEYHAYGLTAQRGKTVDAAFAGFCKLRGQSAKTAPPTSRNT